MDNGALAVLESWQLRPVLMTAAVVACIIYTRGFLKLRRQMPARFPTWRLVAFIGGQATLIVAIASPLDAFSGLLLQVHMVQHLMLMLVAPPLILMGAPVIPMLRGLPASFAHQALGPFLKWPALRGLWNWLTHPITAFIAFTIAMWTWHIPGPYQLALRSPGWHQVEHICFFTSALLFWFPVVQPWPARPVWSRWAMIPYLLLADVQNMFLSVVLTFSERLIYPIYGAVPRLDGITALSDQVAAGAIMWVPGSMFFLVPAIGIAAGMLAPHLVPQGTARNAAPIRVSIREPSAPRDFLRTPAIGTIVRSLYFRRAVQTIVLIVAAAVIIDGFRGPGASPLNLAGVLPWIYWRGILVIGLMAVGNLFCFACPFTLARDMVRRIIRVDLIWPRWLRTKWIAIAILGLFFCGYEVFGLWDSPRMTASLIAGYFAAAIAIDVLFSGATFCKYLCPIGQFQFIQSAISPLEVRARTASICASCTTHDCLRGNETSRGCELDLFMPRKAGNLDCTLCLDCVRACPHDNIGLFAVAPGADLIGDPVRSSIGRMSRRRDIVVLAMIVVFGGFAGAAAMVAPVADWEAWLARVSGMESPRLIVAAFFVLTLIVIPIALYMLAGAVDRIIVKPVGATAENWREISRRFAYSLIPLGFAMWTAHLMFHLLTGLDSIGGVLSRIPSIERSGWQSSFAWPAGSTSLLNLELLILDAGLLITLYVAWRIARTIAGRLRAAAALVAPWAAIAIVLYLTGVWTIRQPMPMRGTMEMQMQMMPGMPMPMKMSASTATLMTTVVRPVSMIEER